jgi:hypothetical protein
MSKKTRNRRLARLGDRDFEIFEHIARYRLTTPDFLHRVFFNDGSQLNAVTKVTSRLTRQRFLNRWELFGSNAYFVLGPLAIGYLPVSRRRTAELGGQALPHEFAMAAFCLRSQVTRKRLTVSELSKNPGQLVQKGVDNSHYFLEETDGVTRLGHFVLDLGGDAAYVARKCAEQIELRQRRPPLRQLIDSRRFLLGIATGTEEKKAEILRVLGAASWPVEFRIEVVPELVPLVGALQGD